MKNRHTTHVVLTFTLCNDVTIFRICQRVHAQRSYLFPELLNQPPQTPLCEIQTDLKSVSMPCLVSASLQLFTIQTRGVSLQGFDLAGRQWTLVPPIGSHMALTLKVFWRHKIRHQIGCCSLYCIHSRRDNRLFAHIAANMTN